MNRSHKFILIVDFSGWTSGGIPGVLFPLTAYLQSRLQDFSQGNRIKILGDKQRWRCVNDDRCREIL